MANTHDYSIANDTGSAVRTDLNTLFTEIEAANAGASAPTNTAEGKLWYDTGNNVYKMYDGSAWVAISAKMDAVSASSGGTFTGAVTLPSPVINTGVSGTAILDEDAMGSDSATQLATQQSIKAYVDSAATQATTAAQGVGTGDSPSFATATFAGATPTQKQYTLTLAGGNLSSTTYAVGIPFQTINGVWWLTFNIGWNTSASAAPSTSISGINCAVQTAVTSTQNVGPSRYLYYSHMNAGGGSISTYWSFSASGDVLRQSGTVRLAAKPTWAD